MAGSTPSVDAICGLSLLLILVPAPRDFSEFSGFPPSREHTDTFETSTSVESSLVLREYTNCVYVFFAVVVVVYSKRNLIFFSSFSRAIFFFRKFKS